MKQRDRTTSSSRRRWSSSPSSFIAWPTRLLASLGHFMGGRKMVSIEEARRLAQLVKIGYRIYRGTLAIPAPPPKPPAEPVKGFSEAAYVEGLKREIEENYSSPDGMLQYLISKVRDGSLPAFSESDCATAVEILDELLTTALFVQSSFGDSPEAIRELESQVPGLPRFLYGDILGYYAYINH